MLNHLRSGLRYAGLSVAGLTVAFAVSAQTPPAEESSQPLIRVLEIEEVAQVLRDEGLFHGQDLNRNMLGGLGGALWDHTIDQIYNVEWMTRILGQTLDQHLKPDEKAAVLAYFETELGQKILDLETAARVAMSDPDVEEVARATYEELRGSDDEQLKLVTKFITVNDLLERNVAGTLSSSYQFYKGLADGGASEATEDDILADVWRSVDDVRLDTEGWLYGFLLMAYQPLEPEEMQSYIRFSEGRAGQALNSALFEGFDLVFNDVSYALGVALARAMNASDLLRPNCTRDAASNDASDACIGANASNPGI